VISFIGDSTFFHSGIPGLINAVFNKHNFTLFILDNRTTAMTGHQPNPGVDMEELNMPDFGHVSIEAMVKAAGVEHISVIKPFNIKKSVATIKEALEFEGVSVVISREVCALYAKALKKPKRNVFMVGDRCKNHKNCVDELGCPAFYLHEGRVRFNFSYRII